MNIQNHNVKNGRIRRLLAGLLVGSSVLAACGTSTSAAPATPTTSAATATTAGSASGSVGLPVTDNPITTSSTVEALKIDSVLVENNIDAAGKDTSDHLEIALTNTGSHEISGFDGFYTFT